MTMKSILIPLVVMFVLTVGALGFKVYDSSFDIRSQAARPDNSPPGQKKKLPILIDKTSITVTLDRGNAVSGMVYAPGFTITSQSATAWQIKYNEPTQGQGFYESSGGITPGSSTEIRTYINASKPNGVYSGSAVVQYYLNGKWYNGPTVRYSITLTGSTATPTPSGTLTVDKTSVVVSLDRGNAVSGLVYGPGFTITSHGATAWQIRNNEPTQGQGFYESSGGITPGQSQSVRTYMNTNKSNGTYSGSAVVRYAVNGTWYDGPTVSYSITLIGGTVSIDTSSVTVTLDRSNAVGGLVYGTGFTITSQGATGWQIKYNEPTQGQGFYESSGGIVPGGTSPIRSYISTGKANGVYSGSATVMYFANGIWSNGPTVTYSITLQ